MNEWISGRIYGWKKGGKEKSNNNNNDNDDDDGDDDVRNTSNENHHADLARKIGHVHPFIKWIALTHFNLDNANR